MTKLFDNRYYYCVKLVNSLTGLWPYQSQLKKKMIRLFNWIAMLTYLPPQLKRLFAVGHNLEGFIVCMSRLFTAILLGVKLVVIMLFESEVKFLLDQIQEEWGAISTREEHKILKSYASKTREFCMIYIVFMIHVVVCFILMPTMSPILDIILPRNETRTRYLSFELDYGIDQQTYWFWLWLHTSIDTIIYIIHYMAADTLYILLMFHGCYMFMIVRHKLERVTDSIKASTARSRIENHDCREKRNTWRCEERRRLELEEQAATLKQCIIKHERALECAQTLCEIFAWSLFAAVVMNVTMISISAFELLVMFNWTKMAINGVYISGELVHIFCLNLMSQFILDHSLCIYEAAYSCAWYNMPVKLQKHLTVILMRSREPSKIIAGKMFTMSLENFGMIVQTSMSYFTVLASVQ